MKIKFCLFEVLYWSQYHAQLNSNFLVWHMYKFDINSHNIPIMNIILEQMIYTFCIIKL